MNQITVDIILWKYKCDKLKRHPIYIRMSENRKSKYINTGYKCRLTEWDEKSAKVKASVSNSIIMNTSIQKQLSKLHESIYAYRQEDKHVSLAKIKDIAKDETVYTDFYKFCKSVINDLTGKFSHETIRQMHGEINKMQAFRPSLLISDISPNFLVKYEKYMRSQKENQDNTVWKSMKFVRRMLNEAISQKVLKKDNYPFDAYKLKYIQGLRIYLTLGEVKAIEDVILLPDLAPALYTVGWYFIFCCYSGLRYSDAVQFDFDKHIVNGRLILQTVKSGEPISIKIHSRLGSAINHIRQSKSLYSNQRTNLYLKTIAEIAGIKKNISFHTARHTFAVNCASLGIPVEVVKVLLGHQNIRTTAIYYKITDTRIDQEMNKWDGN